MEDYPNKFTEMEAQASTADNHERPEKVQDKPQLDTNWGSDQYKGRVKERRNNNQRGPRTVHPLDDYRAASGDSNRLRINHSKQSDRETDNDSGRQHRPRGNRESRSNQDKNWRDEGRKEDIASADAKEEAYTKTSTDKHRRRHPDREVYCPRNARWVRDTKNNSAQSSRSSKKTNLSSHSENKQRRADDRLRFRSGKDTFQGPKENLEMGSNKDSSGIRSDHGGQQEQDTYKNLQGSNSSDEHYAGSKEKHKQECKKAEDGTATEQQGMSDTNEEIQQTQSSNSEVHYKMSTDTNKFVERDSKYTDMSSSDATALQHPFHMSGSQKSPTMGSHNDSTEAAQTSQAPYIAQALYTGQSPYAGQVSYTGQAPYTGQALYAGPNPFTGQDAYTDQTDYTHGQAPYMNQGAYGDGFYASEMAYTAQTPCTNLPIGMNAFGGYGNPYSTYGGQVGYRDPIDYSSSSTEFAGEVSIGRGARWNEWYHNLWHGPPQPSGNVGGRHRGNRRQDGSNRISHGRGGYQGWEGRMKENSQARQRPQEERSDTYNIKQQDNMTEKHVRTGDLETEHARTLIAHQPGFIMRNKEKSKKLSERPAKAKCGQQYCGGSESQTGALIEQLTEGTYECLVCCDAIKCEVSVWSCVSCYTVFHLKCIKEWAKSPSSASEDSDGWRCPACRHVTVHIPYVYKCFCGKSRDPKWQPGDTPHSCGEVCRRKRTNTGCTHPCTILCHPGPCPQCPANVKKACTCGRTKQTVRCGAVPVLRCQQVCGKLLNCALHKCEIVCHADKCEDCQIKITQGCYCGKDKREILCGSTVEADESSHQYSCTKECGRQLLCGHHVCRDSCHSGDCDPCRLVPEVVTTCPCGQTLLAKLLELEEGNKRTKCTDPIPTCQKTCGKPLLCGGDNVHTCKNVCHEGECGPCPDTSMVRCRCGHRYIDVACAGLMAECESNPHICDRKCTKRKSCGKHRCQQKCCVDPGHLCMVMCGRKLNCGVHKCEAPCHPGNCVRCLEANFEELYCHCGASVIMPPIACGTKPPECNQQCVRRHKCAHPVRHTCHSDEQCPPCAELSSKMCMGGHEMRHNLPCYIDDVSCGNLCKKPLSCKQHVCQKTCHRGYCGGECSQPCQVPRTDCGHPCNAPCHPGQPCPKQRCKAKVTIKCACGHLAETTQCLQGVDDSQLTEAFQKELRPLEPHRFFVPGSQQRP